MMKSRVIVLALAMLAADLVVAAGALLARLEQPVLAVAALNLVALFAICCLQASGVPILDAVPSRRR